MRIDWWTLLLQTVNVLVLVWILGRFLFRPIADGLAARRAAAERLIADAEAKRAEAETDRAAAAAELAARRAERDAAAAAARTDAAEAGEAMRAAARDEAARLVREAEAEIAHRRASEEARAGERAGRLAVAIAARLMTRLPPEAQILGFVPGLAEALAALPAATRAEFGAAGAPLRPIVPRPLDPAERERLAAALGGVLGRIVRIEESVDPDVLAGLEIETAHAAVRNSLRADLARIEAELTRHDPS